MADTVYRVRVKYDVDTKDSAKALDDLAAKLDKLWGMIKGAAALWGFQHLTNQIMALHGAAETTRIAIAGLMQANEAFGTTGKNAVQNWNNAMGMSAEILKFMRKDAARLPGEFEDLVTIFRQALPGGLRTGKSVFETEQLSAKLMAVSAALQIDSQTAAHNFAMMMQGRAISHSPLWSALKAQITDDKGKNLTLGQFNALSDDKRWAAVEKALDKYGAVGKEFESTWEAVSSTLTDVGKALLKAFGASIFDAIKNRLNDINNIFASNEGSILRIAKAVGSVFGTALDIGLGLVIRIGSALLPVMSALGEMIEQILPRITSFVGIFTSIIGTVFDVLGTVLGAVLPFIAAGIEGLISGFVAAFEGVWAFFGAVADAIRAVVGFITKVMEGLGYMWDFRDASQAAATAAESAKLGIKALGEAVGYIVGGVVLLSGAVKAITAAQWLWNIAMAANPIGLIIILIIALVAAIALLILYWDKAAIAAEDAMLRMIRALQSAPELAAVLGVHVNTSQWTAAADAMEKDLHQRRVNLAIKEAQGKGDFLSRLSETAGVNIAGKLGIKREGEKTFGPENLSGVERMLYEHGKKRATEKSNVNVSVRIEQTVNDARDPDRIRLVTLDAIQEVMEHAMNNPTTSAANRFHTMRP